MTEEQEPLTWSLISSYCGKLQTEHRGFRREANKAVKEKFRSKVSISCGARVLACRPAHTPRWSHNPGFTQGQLPAAVWLGHRCHIIIFWRANYIQTAPTFALFLTHNALNLQVCWQGQIYTSCPPSDDPCASTCQWPSVSLSGTLPVFRARPSLGFFTSWRWQRLRRLGI